MARRAIPRAPKKPARKTRNEVYLVNLKYMGEEPTYKKPLTNSDYMNALNWYNTMAENSEAREFVETYLKNKKRMDEYKLFKRVPDVWVPRTAAWVARLLSRGYTLPESAEPFFERKLAEALSKVKGEEETPKEPKKVVSIQDRVRDKTMDIVAEIEGMIDSNEEFSLYDWLKQRETPAAYCSSIIAYYTPWLGELLEASEGKDPQLKEAYGYMNKKQLKERIVFINGVIEGAERYAGVAKKTRKPRKARPVTKEKILKSFKFKREDPVYKIASIDPEKVVGAQELWTFNTRYKILTVFRADEPSGLSVKGTSIVGYDHKTSVSRGTGRKTQEIVDRVLKGGKLVLRKMMDEIPPTKTMLQHRVNEHTVLLRVVN